MKNIIASFCFLLLLAAVPVDALAVTGSSLTDDPGTGPSQTYDGQPLYGEVQLQNPLDSSISTIPDFFRAIISVLLVFAIPFIVFFIVWAGFLYVTARGNAEKIKQAHSALLYALIGGLLILGANLLLDIITNTVNEIRN